MALCIAEASATRQSLVSSIDGVNLYGVVIVDKNEQPVCLFGNLLCSQLPVGLDVRKVTYGESIAWSDCLLSGIFLQILRSGRVEQSVVDSIQGYCNLRHIVVVCLYVCSIQCLLIIEILQQGVERSGGCLSLDRLNQRLTFFNHCL